MNARERADHERDHVTGHYWKDQFDDFPDDEVLDLAAEAESEPSEPSDGDYVTEDHRVIREFGTGRTGLTVPDNVPFGPWLSGWMTRDGYFPNVWFLSDHGNAHLIDISK